MLRSIREVFVGAEKITDAEVLERAAARGVELLFRARIASATGTRPAWARSWVRFSDEEEDASVGMDAVYEAILPLPHSAFQALVGAQDRAVAVEAVFIDGEHCVEPDPSQAPVRFQDLLVAAEDVSALRSDTLPRRSDIKKADNTNLRLIKHLILTMQHTAKNNCFSTPGGEPDLVEILKPVTATAERKGLRPLAPGTLRERLRMAMGFEDDDNEAGE